MSRHKSVRRRGMRVLSLSKVERREEGGGRMGS